MTILYSNGCSYTANHDLNRKDRYPIILADQLGYRCIDRAEPGSCNSRIIRVTINDCIKLKKDNENILALIQLSHLARTEYPDETNPLDDLFFSIKPEVSNNLHLEKDVQMYSNLYWKLYSDKIMVMDLLTKLVGLVGFFNQTQIKYLIYLGPLENELYQIDDCKMDYLIDKNVLDLKTFSMLGLLGNQNIHPDVQGMEIIADYFYKKLRNSSD
jgi:hypothetical protein